MIRLILREIILYERSQEFFEAYGTFLAAHLFSGRALRKEEGGDEKRGRAEIQSSF